MTKFTEDELVFWTIERLQAERQRTQEKRDEANTLAVEGDESAMWAVRDHDDFMQAIDAEMAKRGEHIE